MSKQKSSTRKLVHLSTTQMRRMPKPRKGFEPHAQRLAALVAKHVDQMKPSGVDPAALLDELAAYESVHADAITARSQLAAFEETEFLHASNVWAAMLRIYAFAKLVAGDDPEMQEAIAEFEQFMRSPRKAGKAPVTPAAA